ncbi:MAG TPA: hypothetical protein VMW42_11340 [Desulfatiglandales bacterium]|nr:hypothetical protein [Desulfatiglandales bacterium]
MATDYIINVFLDDAKIDKMKKAGLGDHITEVGGKKAVKVPLPDKNERKFRKAFPGAALNDKTGAVDNFPEDAANLLFDVVIENKSLDIMSLFLMKAFKPLAGKPLRSAIH